MAMPGLVLALVRKLMCQAFLLQLLCLRNACWIPWPLTRAAILVWRDACEEGQRREAQEQLQSVEDWRRCPSSDDEYDREASEERRVSALVDEEECLHNDDEGPNPRRA